MTRSLRRLLLSLALAAAPFGAALAQAQHAHVHGQIKLDIAIEGPTISISMNSPLDNLLGFERAPRTEAEKKAVEVLAAQLRAADQLIQIDPAANCKLGPVELQSPVLGLSVGKPEAAPKADDHAELDAHFHFNCIGAAQARFIELGLFAAFKPLRQIDAQIVSPQGQFKRTLRRPNARLSWGQ